MPLRLLDVLRFALLAFAIAPWLASGALAQAYPARTITLIVPFAPGGAADVTGRLVADGMTRHLGQRVIVENVAGAGGTTGVTRGAQAAPDGYTLTLGHTGTHAFSVGLYRDLRYDPRTSFAPIALVSRSPGILFARADLPANTLPEFIALLRQRGADLSNGHSGVGSLSHVFCALLAQAAGREPTFVPYRGNGPMVNDMLGGNVDFSCDIVVSVAGHVRSGVLKGIAIAGPARSGALPNVPSAVEAGFPDFQAESWTAIFAPTATPPEVVARLNDAIGQTLADETYRRRMQELGGTVPSAEEATSSYLAELIAREVPRWTEVIRRAGIASQ